MRTLRLLSALLLVTGAATACAPADKSDDAGSAAPSGSACTPGSLKTLTAGKLTFGTDDPVYPPWFADNKPDSGQGFEGAVARAVATKLGYTADQVAWVRVPFNNAIAPGAKKYDIDINEFSITDVR